MRWIRTRKCNTWSFVAFGIFTIFMFQGLKYQNRNPISNENLFMERIHIAADTTKRENSAANINKALQIPTRSLNGSYLHPGVKALQSTAKQFQHRWFNEFSSLSEAHSYMQTIMDIVPTRIVIHYPTFDISLPNFIDDSDEELFLNSRLNKENLNPPTEQQLIGEIEVIQDGTFMSRDFDCGFKADYDFIRESRSPSVGKSYNILAPIIVPHAFEFQHFYDGTLPKIIQALPLLRKKGVKIILEPPEHGNINLILEKLGFAEDDIILHPLNDRTSVYYAKYMIMTCIAPPLHPLLWKDARDRLGVPKSLPFPSGNNYVMLLTRAGAQKTGRNMLNEKEVKTFLKKRYDLQLVIFHGGYSLYEAIQLFSAVKIIIGVHGGAFYNMNYAPYDTTVIEIGPILSGGGDIGLPHAIFWAMAELLGQSYWRIPAESGKGMNVEIDLQKLERILDIVDKKYENEVLL